MIHSITGNLLESPAEALVNTVNTVGVMGKGLALQFREEFPENYRLYREACKRHELSVGNMFITEDSSLLHGRKLIINFPTKIHWRYPSKYDYISEGLKSLKKEIVLRGLKSVAIPPLGSHNGGLDWHTVRKMIFRELEDLDCDIYLYEPDQAIAERMKAERVKLTPARAMLLLMFGKMVGTGEFASVFAAEKLIYFMQRFGGKDFFKIDFQPYYYGPYSGGKIAHVLYHLNGSFIKGMGSMDSRPFDFLWLMDDAEDTARKYLSAPEYNEAMNVCNQTSCFLNGYFSNFSLELLASIDYLLTTNPSFSCWRTQDTDITAAALELELEKWNRRKSRLFTRELIVKGLNHIREWGL